MPIFLVTPRLSYRKTILADNPFNYWRLGETGGFSGSPLSKIAIDETGNHDGTYFHTPTLGVNGLINDPNTAVTFTPAQSEYIETTSPGILGSNPHAVECWLRTTDSRTDDGGCIAYWGVEATSSKGVFRLDTGRPRVEISGGYKIFNILVNDNDIYHVVFVFPSSSSNVSDYLCYVNGSSIGQFDLLDVAVNIQSGTKIHIAHDPNHLVNNRYWDGTLDEIAIYDYELTPTQIQKHYNAGI